MCNLGLLSLWRSTRAHLQTFYDDFMTKNQILKEVLVSQTHLFVHHCTRTLPVSFKTSHEVCRRSVDFRMSVLTRGCVYHHKKKKIFPISVELTWFKVRNYILVHNFVRQLLTVCRQLGIKLRMRIQHYLHRNKIAIKNSLTLMNKNLKSFFQSNKYCLLAAIGRWRNSLQASQNYKNNLNAQ